MLQEIARLDPYRVTIVTNQDRTEKFGIAKKVSEYNIPTISVGLAEILLASSNSTALTLSTYFRSNVTEVYLILSDFENNREDNHLEQIQNFFHIFDKLSSKHTRPKCLLIVSLEERAFENSLKILLHYAWTKKFLEVTILKVIGNGNQQDIELYHYNPFNDTNNKYSITPWDLISTLFPNKLRDMNRYRIKVPIFDLPPSLSVQRNSNGSVNLFGLNYVYTFLLSKTLNFVIDHTDEVIIHNLAELYPPLRKLLDDGSVNMLPVPLYARFFVDYETSFAFNYRKYVVLVPVVQKNHVILSDSLFRNLVLGAAFFVLIKPITRLVKFEERYWEIINVIAVLLGVAVPSQPKKTIERFFFIIAVCASATYLSHTLLEMIAMKISEDTAFDTIKDISNSDLALVIDPAMYDRLFPPGETLSNIIKPKLVNNMSPKECIDWLERTQKYACFLEKNRAELTMNVHYRSHKVPVMKIAKPEITADFIVYAFEKSSAYAERFNEILYKLFESGIQKIWPTMRYVEYATKPMSENIDEQQSERSLLALQLIAILIVGFGLSFVVFCAEKVVQFVRCKT